MSALAYRIANESPDEAAILLVKHGYPAAQNKAELEYYIDDFIAVEPDTAGRELLEIHPDREFFEDFGMAKPERTSNCCGANGGYSNCSGSGHSNCSGCGGKCGQKMSNAAGDGGSASVAPQQMQYSMISNGMMLGMLAIVTIGIFGMIIAKR